MALKPTSGFALVQHGVNDARMFLIRHAYSAWAPETDQLEDGYTVLLPTPADLPVFFDLAMEVLSHQNKALLREIVVIPDWPSPSFEAYLKERCRSYEGMPVRTVSLKSIDKWAWRLTKSITTRHFTQLLRGIDALRTSHAIIHDCDLFLPPGNFLLEQYLTCTQEGLSVYGLDVRRSLARTDREEFVATWEMTFSTKWFRSFPPYQHKGQMAVVNGIRQEFDTTLLPQYLSRAESIGWRDRSNEYFHFNYVIASFRNFMTGRGYVPAYSLKLFLIRTLVDAFDRTGWTYRGLPEQSEFLAGMHGLRELVADNALGKTTLVEFAKKLGGLAASGVFSAEKSRFITERGRELYSSIGAPPGLI